MSKFLRVTAVVLLLCMLGTCAGALADTAVVRSLQKGDKGEAVLTLQKRLNSLSYTTASATGTFDQETYRAVKRVQAMLGVKQTGIASKDLQTKLYSSEARYYDKFAPLKKGMKNNVRVADMQRKLKKLGYPAITVNGNYDAATVRAVRLFQGDHSFKEESAINSTQLRKLYDATKQYVKYVPLQQGDKGVRVMKMKERLKALGYLVGTIDNVFNKETRNAVMAFQQKIGYKQSGKAGTKTLRRLFADNAPTRV